MNTEASRVKITWKFYVTRNKSSVSKARSFGLSANFLFSAEIDCRESSGLEKDLEVFLNVPLTEHNHTSLKVLQVHFEQFQLQLDSDSSAL